MDFNTIQSLQEAYSQVQETMVRGGGPKPESGSQSTSAPDPAPAPASAKPQLSQRAQAILSGNSPLSRDPRARGNFDPRYDKKPSTPSTPSTSSSAPKPSSGGSTSPSAPKTGGGGLLGSLDKFARDTAGKLGGEYGAKKGRETLGNIFGIPEREGRRRGTEEGQRMYDKAKETLGGFLKQDYEPDNFDIILEYLVAEGYADTNESAIKIMANMSEEWRKEIMEFRIPNLGSSRESSGTAQGDFEAGGGLTKMKKTGMSRDQVIDQGKKNIGNNPLSRTFSPTRYASDRSTPQGRERNDAYAKAGVKFPEDDERNKQNKLIYGQ